MLNKNDILDFVNNYNGDRITMSKTDLLKGLESFLEKQEETPSRDSFIKDLLKNTKALNETEEKPEINIVIGVKGGFVSYVATDSDRQINCIVADYDARNMEDGPELSYEIVFKDKNKFREYEEEIEEEAGEV